MNYKPTPNVFGPSTWKTLHYIAYGYPEIASPALQQKTLQFIDALPYLLPCEACGEHLFENLKNSPPNEAVKTRDGMINYFHSLHNVVNRQLGKPILSREESEVQLFTNSGENGKINYMMLLGILLIGVAIGYIIVRKE